MVFLVVAFVFLLILIYYSTFNYIEVSGDYLRFKWFMGERFVKVEDVLSFYQLSELGGIAPLYKVGRIQIFTPLWILIGNSFIVVPVLFRVSWMLGVMFLVLMLFTVLSILLPAGIGRKVFCGFVFMVAGYLIDVFIIRLLDIGIVSLDFLVLTGSILVLAFLFGYFLCGLKRWMWRYDHLIVRVLMDDRERTIIVNGKVREINRFKEALIDVMKNVKVA